MSEINTKIFLPNDRKNIIVKSRPSNTTLRSLIEDTKPKDKDFTVSFYIKKKKDEFEFIKNEVTLDEIKEKVNNPDNETLEIYAAEVYSGKIEQSDKDKREYRFLKLHNQIKILLVNDKESTMAGAALNVGIGSIRAPKDEQGLVHFIEHLFFMGSKKYSSKDEFLEYFTNNGGEANAYTAEEKTCLMIEIPSDKFPDALDILSCSISAPLMTDESIKKERDAVNSEDNKNSQIDIYRNDLVEKSLIGTDHPKGIFSCGNKETLKHCTSDKVNDFLKEYYTKVPYSLVLYGPNDLKSLEKYALYFARIEKDKEEPNNYDKNPYKSLYKKIIFIKPVSAISHLYINIEIDTILYNDPNGYSKTLMLLLSHNSENGFVYHVKKNGYATNVIFDISCDTYATKLTCRLSLTKEKEYKEIIAIFFQYIEYLKTTFESKHLDICDIIDSNCHFEFENYINYNVYNYVTELADSVEKYKTPALILKGPFLYNKDANKNEGGITEILKELKYEKTFVYVNDKYLYELSEEESKTEKIHSVEYKTESLSQPSTKNTYTFNWNVNCKYTQDEKKIDDKSEEEIEIIKIKEKQVHIFSKKDNLFKNPKIIIGIELRNQKRITESTFIFQDIYLMLIDHILSKELFWELYFHYSFSITQTSTGLYLKFTGFHSNILDYIERIISPLFDPEKDKFKEDDGLIKNLFHQYKKNLQQFEYSQPFRIASTLTKDLLSRYSYPARKLLNELSNFQETTEMCNKVKEGIQNRNFGVQIFIYGNTNQNKTSEIAKEIISLLEKESIKIKSLSECLQNSAILFQNNLQNRNDFEKFHYPLLNEKDKNSCALITYNLLTGIDITINRVLLKMFNKISSNYVFKKLRTEKQLGYVVTSCLSELYGMIYFGIIVQSEHKLSKDLLEIEENFFDNDLKTYLKQLDDETIKGLADGLKKGVEERHKSTSEEFTFYFGKILGNRKDFTSKEDEAKLFGILNEETKFFSQAIDRIFDKENFFKVCSISLERDENNTSKVDCFDVKIKNGKVLSPYEKIINLAEKKIERGSMR